MTRGKKGPIFCTEDDCNRKHYGRGLCELHYDRWRKETQLGKCSINNCNKTIKNKNYCSMHYTRWYRYGDTDFIPPKRTPKNKKPKGKLNFLYDLREEQKDSPEEFNKIFGYNFREMSS